MEYKRTYDTLSQVYGKISERGLNAYLVGGISAPIQTGKDLYRQNDDLDLMVDENDLEEIMSVLGNNGYIVRDKRGIKTENYVDENGEFHAADHELNANTNDRALLGVGIFVYRRDNGSVTLNSYAYDEREKAVIGSRKVMPEELFDLMYSSEKVDYHGTKVMTSSKEYTYMSKSRGKREKDKLDARVLEPYIDEKSEERIKRIKVLEKRIKHYFDRYNERGEVESSEKVPELEDSVYNFIKDYASRYPNITSEELIEKIIEEPKVAKIMESREDVACILGKLKDFKDVSVDRIAFVARDISHMYCYDDEFEKSYTEYSSKKRNAFIAELESQTATTEEFSKFCSEEESKREIKSKKIDEIE